MVFNFEMEDMSVISKIFTHKVLPTEVLNPLGIFNEDVIKRLVRDSDNFSKNDNFRIVFVSKDT